MSASTKFAVCLRPATPDGDYSRFQNFVESADMWIPVFGNFYHIQTREPIAMEEFANQIQKTLPDASRFYIASVNEFTMAPAMA